MPRNSRLIQDLSFAWQQADEVESKIRLWELKADGDSNDAEHDAAFALAESSKQLVSAVRAIIRERK